MCGIVGLSWKDEHAITKAVETIKHRGPDDQGVYVDNHVSLGHVRLSIIDTSSLGHQPFIDKETKRIIVFNGEIYNFEEVKKKLPKKYTFTSHSDTEVILKAYDAWGEKCVEYFNGMWAFCIYDKEKEELFLSRDRFGKKPLYYTLTEKGLAFSSEMKSLLPRITPSVHAGMVSDFLYYDFIDHTDDTFIEQIRKLPASHNAVYSLKDSSFSMKKYYELKKSKSAFFPAFVKACNYRTVADVPISLSLSGGVDSSSIAAVYADQGRKLKAFTTTAEGGRGDETANINYLLKEYPGKFDLKKIPIDISEYVDVLRECIYHTETPTVSGVIPRWMIAKGVREQGYKVLISGEGADEMLGGYRSAYPFVVASLFRQGKIKDASTLWKEGTEYIGVRETGFMLFYASPLWLKRILLYAASTSSRKSHGFIVPFSMGQRLRNAHFNQPEDYFTYGLWRGGIPPLLNYNDKIPMAFGVEVRCPFMDVDVVESIMSMKATKRVAKGYTKYALRKELSHLVPKEIIWDKKKIGFQSPEHEYLCLPKTQKFIIERFSKNPHSAEFVDSKVFLKKYKKFISNGKGNVGYFVKVLSLELWLEQFITSSI